MLRKTKKWKEIVQNRASNKQIIKFLAENKYTVKSWESADKIISKIPKHLQHYWFRGLFDGDGNLYIRRNNATLTIASGFQQDWKYLQNLCKKFNIKYSITRNSKINPHTGNLNQGSTFKIYNTIGIKKFGKFIYTNREKDKIGLERKYNSFLPILDFKNFTYRYDFY